MIIQQLPKIGDEVLIRHPDVGSLWTKVTGLENGIVEGWYWDTSDCGSPYLPDDYSGQKEFVCFPVSCIFKVKE